MVHWIDVFKFKLNYKTVFLSQLRRVERMGPRQEDIGKIGEDCYNYWVNKIKDDARSQP